MQRSTNTAPPARVLAVPAAVLLAVLAVAAWADTAQVGAPLTVTEVTPLAVVAENPDRYEGREVRVEGTVTGVCQKRGCWMELADDQGHTLRVKVEDGVIVFPVEAEGGRAAVQGKVEIVPLEREEYIAWQRHLAEDAGEEYDETSAGPGPYRLVRLRGHGAQIQIP